MIVCNTVNRFYTPTYTDIVHPSCSIKFSRQLD